ncbi:MAG: hypothetical protein ABEL76_04450 [Bradymonadaceae bacterium]
MEDGDRHSTDRRWGEALGLAGWAAFHTAGVAAVAAGMALCATGFEGARAYVSAAVEHAQFPVDVPRLALHLGLSAVVWALGQLAIRYVQSSTRRGRAAGPELASRGTVLTEFLIVLAPFLLLLSGLAQLAINNITRVMADYAAFQGARAAWVWQAEEGREVDWTAAALSGRQLTRTRARLAAAQALAPTAPGDFRIGRLPRNIDGRLIQLSGAMAASFMPGPRRTGAAGRRVARRVRRRSSSRRSALPRSLSLVGGVDTSSMRRRAVQKLMFAYLAFQSGNQGREGFRVVDRGREVGVHFTYQMNQVFPWFTYLWGGVDTIGGRPGYYLPVTRHFTLDRQIPVHGDYDSF